MIVVVGDLLVDVLVRHAAPLAHGSDTAAVTTLSPGGAGGNVASWLVRAGADVALIGCVGDDALADVALTGLGARGDAAAPAAGVRRVPGAATGTCVVLVGPDAERTMLPDAGANALLGPSDIPALGGGDVLFVSGYTLLREATRPAALAALAGARAVGARTVLDPASAAPLAAAPGVVVDAGPFDLLLPNADEAAVLGEDGLGCASEVVVTAGAHGATWRSQTATARVRATGADRAVDTTGAGDAFAAGFVSVWAADGSVDDALAAGTALAAEAIAHAGGRPAGGVAP